MDKEQARFILSSYRPGIDDAADNQLANALALAADNRELGEWLAEQRAMDEAFSRALSEIELPDGLRDDIIGCLAGERTAYPNADDSQDAAMIGALASVKVPDGLRDNILSAMARSANRSANRSDATAPGDSPSAATPTLTKVVPIWKKLSMPLAAAAGIALALIVTRPTKPNDAVAATNQLVPIEAVPVSFIQTYESPSFSLEVKQDQPEQLVEVLRSRSLPCPCCLPPGLKGSKSVGCRELNINGKHGSLICFRTDTHGVVHLIIFNRTDVDGSCKNKLNEPCYIDEGKWSVARWQNDENVFFLIGQTDVEELKSLF